MVFHFSILTYSIRNPVQTRHEFHPCMLTTSPNNPQWVLCALLQVSRKFYGEVGDQLGIIPPCTKALQSSTSVLHPIVAYIYLKC